MIPPARSLWNLHLACNAVHFSTPAAIRARVRAPAGTSGTSVARVVAQASRSKKVKNFIRIAFRREKAEYNRFS
jgi:hypothetical protein